ncbi:hypothetical protein ACMXYO_06340 [Neptuniibacter sp. QD37_6]|uniref:hypothetical protein n=1 Tax=Neptuniibacter sp. QD37_6 TaxID=3398210 RepID=UPI0039F50B48
MNNQRHLFLHAILAGDFRAALVIATLFCLATGIFGSVFHIIYTIYTAVLLNGLLVSAINMVVLLEVPNE